MVRILIAAIFITIISCQAQKSAEATTICYSFDQRQCQVDSFAEFISDRQNADSNIEGIIKYLTEQDINVHHAKVDMNFHEIVCQACEVCPETHRFFVSIESLDENKMKRLDLMSMEELSCSDHF